MATRRFTDDDSNPREFEIYTARDIEWLMFTCTVVISSRH